MASQQSTAGQVISEMAKAEGGPSKGSASAQMQSEVSKQNNAQNGSTKSEAGQVISEVAKAEGGPTKGSTAARMQSEVTKQRNGESDADDVTQKLGGRLHISESSTTPTNGKSLSGSAEAQAQSMADKENNFEQAVEHLRSKVASDPSSITSEDASHMQSREARLLGGQPPADSISTGAQHLANENENPQPADNHANGNGLNPTEQSHLTKEQNFEQAAVDIGNKMANAPETVTKEDAAYLHSREQRAHGTTEKGGITSEAHKLADANAKA